MNSRNLFAAAVFVFAAGTAQAHTFSQFVPLAQAPAATAEAAAPQAAPAPLAPRATAATAPKPGAVAAAFAF